MDPNLQQCPPSAAFASQNHSEQPTVNQEPQPPPPPSQPPPPPSYLVDALNANDPALLQYFNWWTAQRYNSVLQEQTTQISHHFQQKADAHYTSHRQLVDEHEALKTKIKQHEEHLEQQRLAIEERDAQLVQQRQEMDTWLDHQSE
jgi:hypothetical protein